MSFTLLAAGTIEQVRRQVRHAVNFGVDSSQLDELREYLLAQLEHWPASHQPGYDNGLMVEASGHQDKLNGYLTLKIRPLQIPQEGTDVRPRDH